MFCITFSDKLQNAISPDVGHPQKIPEQCMLNNIKMHNSPQQIYNNKNNPLALQPIEDQDLPTYCWP